MNTNLQKSDSVGLQILANPSLKGSFRLSVLNINLMILLLGVFIFPLFLNTLNAQTTVFTDDFNRASLSSGGTPSMTYTNVLPTNGTASILSSAYLSISSKNVITYNKFYVYGSTSTFISPYNSTLGSINSSSTVTWTSNFRWRKNSTTYPQKPGISGFSQAIILAASGSDLASGTTGYAIVYGDAALNNDNKCAIRLVKFSNGLSDGNITDIINVASGIATPNNFASVRVTYQPATNTWALYFRDDGASAWSDPSTGVSTQKGSNTTDATYTSSSLPNFGFYWNNGNGTDFSGDFDNFKVVVSTPTITTPSPTSLSGFSTTTGTASASQTFTVGGSSLNANLVITAPADYEVRENLTGSFGSSVSFTPSSGTVATKTIELRIKSTASVGTPSGNVVCSSTGATSQNVAVSGEVTAAAGPVILVGSVTSFGNQAINTTSTQKDYTVSGNNLTNDIVITPPANFEISTTSGSNFVANPSTITLTKSGNTVAETKIYVRFAPTAVQAYSGNITHTSTDATQQDVAVSGNGTYPEPTNYPASFTATKDSYNQITVTWTDATGAQLPAGYLIKAAINPATPSAPVDATAESDAALVKNIAQGTQQVVFTGLSSATTYNFIISPYTNSGMAIDYKTDGVIPTASATTNAVSAASDYFRSKQTGDWQTASTWESSSDNTNWISATLAPTGTGAGANNITILNGHTVTVTAASGTLTVDQVTVNTGGQITINSGKGLLIAPGTGTDLTLNGVVLVNGTLTIQGNATAIVNGTLTQNGSVVLKSGALLTVNGLIECNATATMNDVGNFTIASAGTLKTAHANGLNGTLANSGSKTLNSAANYVFNGIVAQTTGALLTAANSLEIDNSAGVDISANTSVTSLTINSGKVLNIPATKQLSVSGTLANNGTLNLRSTASGTASIITPASISGSGTANVEQYLSTPRNWYISSPISNATVPTGKSYYFYNEAGTNLSPADPYWATATESSPMTAGVGYIAQPTEASTLTFVGALNSVDVPVTLYYHSGKGNGFNLVGNPYPSYINWQTVAADNTAANMPTGTMWYRTIDYNGHIVWSPSTTYAVDDIIYNGTRFYKVVTAGTSAATGGPTGTASSITDNDIEWAYQGSIYIFATVNSDGEVSPATVSNLVPPMQAFWVKTNTGGGTLTFKNAMRSQNSVGSNLLKAPKSSSSEMPFVRLSVTNGVSADESVIYASTNASNSFDKNDAPKYFNTASSNQPEIYTQIGSEKLVINAMNELSMGTEIPLGFATEKENNFSISATEVKNFGSDMLIILKDKQTISEFNLTDGQVYNFSSSAVNDANRFSLIFRAPDTTTDLKRMEQNTQVYVNAANQITVKFNEVPENAVVKVYSALGQLLAEKVITESSTVLNGISEAGVYFVSILRDGNAVTKKVIIN